MDVVGVLVAIVFGVIAGVVAFRTLRYTKGQYDMQLQKAISVSDKLTIFLTRDEMVGYLLAMYDRASPGDVIWGQCVSCRDYTGEVRRKILDGAAKGIHYKIIVSSHAPEAESLRELFAAVRNAEVLEAADNKIRIHGLSTKEVMIGLPDVERYTALLVRDQHFTAIIKAWFDDRFNGLAQASKLGF